tara:strand:+ start:33 stop:293 length:261 start_codon:yes stop_codon:yes gene_type:complete
MVSSGGDGNDPDVEVTNETVDETADEIVDEVEDPILLTDGIWAFTDSFGKKDLFFISGEKIVNLKQAFRYSIEDLKKRYEICKKVR